MKNKSRREAAPAAANNADSMLHAFGQMVERTPANLMYADKDLVIRYINRASRETLKKIKHLLPCKVDEIVGKSVDVFHKDPARVRGILSGSGSLPHHATFALGPEEMELSANAIYDANGELAGYMATWDIVTEKYRLEQAMQAIYQSRPCVEFDIEGNVIRANDLFLRTMGYTIDEIRGKNHRIFVREADRELPENATLWSKVEAGAAQSGEFRRLGKDHKEVWIACTYYPIPDIDGKIHRVMQFMTDITERKLRDNNVAGQIQAISRVQPVSEYSMDGSILNVNDNFERLFGYSSAELIGKHVSVFVDEATRQSAEYQAAFKAQWEKLRRGEACVGEAKRTNKQGKEVWIQYSYNPILDLDGQPCKVINYLRDVTEQKAALNGMMANVMTLVDAALEGRLSTRADAAKHEGDYRKIVEGVNRTLDAVIGPLNVAGDYVDKISKGNIPAKITDSYKGDFNVIKDNLNACIDGLAGLQEANAVIQRMERQRLHHAREGRLRGDFCRSGARRQWYCRTGIACHGQPQEDFAGEPRGPARIQEDWPPVRGRRARAGDDPGDGEPECADRRCRDAGEGGGGRESVDPRRRQQTRR